MAADLGISVAAKLLEAIGSEVVRKVCDMWGYKSQLAELNETVSTIHKVLLDAEAKRELTNQEEDYIEKLKDAVYDADDLFDEFLTLAELKQLRPKSKTGKFYEKVRCFFSSKNQVGRAYRMSREVKDIKKRLDLIANNRQNFGFGVDYKPIIRRREDTCCYVDASDIIGRDKDKEDIIDMLLDHDNAATEDSGFVTIVGVGGLGKTALAQLVYNDEKVKKEFPELRLWVCVSDQDGQQFDVKAIFCKILESITQQRIEGNTTMQWVQNQFQDQVRGKKFLLVLDDVWNEDRELWLTFKNFMKLGQGGSKVVVTTCSELTATIIGDKLTNKLGGLSQECSWCLFEMSAFHKQDKEENYNELVEIGKKIIVKCSNIPLAVKVVGSLLYGQHVSKWRSFEESGLAKIGKGNNKIMSILKLSYHNLDYSLKSCFSYCAIFPKDFIIRKRTLIDLWMAQGYIIPLDGGQSIEVAAEEHFLILLRRCFFQDVEKDRYGDVRSLKIHDLMHDVAQDMGRKEICAVTSVKEKLGDKVRHVGYVGDACLEISLCSNKIRSLYTENNVVSKSVVTKIEHWMYLRVLTLSGGIVGKLPDSIGKLTLLRYLDLSNNCDLEVVCDSITKLHNLQTLLFQRCFKLKELPKDFSKLVNLQHLDLLYCHCLTCMPSGLSKLSSLRVITRFVVGKNFLMEKQSEDELQALKSLTNIKGELYIEIGKYYRRAEDMNERGGGGYLKRMEHLSQVTIQFPWEGSGFNAEVLLENLEPHPNLKGLYLKSYKGTTIPKWGRAVDNWTTCFPHLVSIDLFRCMNLQEMPMLSKLPFLKSLILCELKNTEGREDTSSDTEAAELPTFFPSLEILKLENMNKLKGWWNGERSVEEGHQLIFARLCELSIIKCPNLTSFPSCLSVGELTLEGNNDKLEIIIVKPTTKDDDAAENAHDAVKLWKLKTDNMGNLKSLPMSHLTSLKITGNRQMEIQSQVGEAFQSCASSLKFLDISSFITLRRLSGTSVGGLQHFSALHTLSISDSYDEDEDADDTMLWKSIPANLCSLHISTSKNITTLPRGMQYLTSLERLYLYQLYSLIALPEWIDCLSSLQELHIIFCLLDSLPEAMQNLTSLQSLYILGCPYLSERCSSPNGEDLPKIQHIPNIIVKHQL